MVGVQKSAKRRIALNERGQRIGEGHPGAVLTDDEVDLVWELRAGGMSYGRIAAKLEVSKGCVAKILTGQRRGQVAAEVRG